MARDFHEASMGHVQCDILTSFFRHTALLSNSLAAMPFGHLRLIEIKPKNDSYLWKPDFYPAFPRHIGEQIKKRRFDLKLTAVDCRKILGIDKSTLVDWERGRRKPSRDNRQKIAWFLRSYPTKPTS